MQFTVSFIKLFIVGLYLVSPILIFLLAIILILGQIVGRHESWKPFDAAYWSFITATTVGYGDMRPVSRSSRILSVLIALTGLILSGIMVALALNAATISFTQLEQAEKVKTKIEELRK
jgi:voltage-gated potassium channel Kch